MGNGTLSKDFAGDGNNAVTTTGIGATDSSKGTVSLWFNRPASASTDEFLYHRVRGSTAGTRGTEYSGTIARAELTTELAGNADGEVGIFSTWFRIDGGNNTQRVIFQGGPVTGPHLIDLRPLPLIGSGDRIQIQLNKVSPVTFAVFGRSTQTFTAGPTWRHLLLSWDTGLTSGTPRLTMHIDDVLEPLSPFLVSPGVIDYTRGNYSIGGRSATPQLTFPGCFSEYYFNSVATLDMSVVANRRKFITATGLPVELGSDGSTPTGAAPIIYVPDGDATTNAGTGGSFVNVGAVVPCPTIPGVDESDGVKYVFSNSSVRVSLRDASVPGDPGTLGTKYDGTTTTLTSVGTPTGIVDSKKGIFSAWVRLDGPVVGSTRVILDGASGVGSFGPYQMAFRFDGTFQIFGKDSTNTFAMQFVANTGLPNGPNWIHVLASWDQNFATPNRRNMYINDVSNLRPPTFNDRDLAIDYDVGPMRIGGRFFDLTSKLDGCMSEVYFAPGEFLDFTVVANRRKFIDAGGFPVDLGSDGSTPTGTAPIVYFPDGGTSGVNEGTGGSFTKSGTFAACSTLPSPDNQVVDISSMSGITTGVWHHLLASWDHTSLPLKHNLHIDNVDDIDVAGTGNRVGTIDHTALLQAIAGTQTGGVLEYGGCLSEVYFNSTEFIDTSILSNRSLFIDGSGDPVELGPTGALPSPTLTSPIIYLPDGDPANNKGTGGNFVQNGTIAACATVPSPALDARTIIEIVRDEIDAAGLAETDKFLILRLGFSETFLTDALSFFDAGDFRKVAKGVRKAVKFLELAVEKGFDAATATDWSDRLCGAIQSIATTEIDAAIARTGDPVKIAEAQEAFADGDLNKQFFEFLDAINDYEKAIKSATVA